MSKLPQRVLGSSLQVSAMGYGAMGLSEFYGPSDEVDSLNILHSAINEGVTFFDTADMYGRGHNESLIGRCLSGLTANARANLTIATKCGIDRGNSTGYERKINNAPDYIKQSCESSLKRLGLEKIDLYYMHRLDVLTPIEETMDTLASLVREGKILHIGLCEVSVDILQRALSVFPIDAVQTEYSLWTRDVEDEILPFLVRNNIGLVPYSPLGRGFLTGKYTSVNDFSADDFRRFNPRFSEENMAKNLTILEAVKPLSQKYNCSIGQIALAWLLAQSNNIVPIPGTKKEKYLTENIASCHIQLEDADVKLLNNIKNEYNVYGERYTREGMKGISY
ncbi:aldo/keto reductase [Chania multitudinisentens RB-25]|uniref:Aldo/keto reductase n=1 Tax=Chania multitudinisentens RB-25 TaxID=1441930 RepID=W0LB13_9GAMM|nr:aldo/keto reductase [Chania multitudinisentens]AHG20891.1 aldo/keto reductase [Chania multitudinisentens RB-25]